MDLQETGEPAPTVMSDRSWNMCSEGYLIPPGATCAGDHDSEETVVNMRVIPSTPVPDTWTDTVTRVDEKIKLYESIANRLAADPDVANLIGMASLINAYRAVATDLRAILDRNPAAVETITAKRRVEHRAFSRLPDAYSAPTERFGAGR